MYIRQNEVLKVVSNIKNLRLGRKYLSYYDYESVKIDRELRTQEYLIVFKYNINGYNNTTNLTLSEVGAIKSYGCNCSYCNSDTGCAHVALAIFQLANIMQITSHIMKKLMQVIQWIVKRVILKV